VRCRLDVLCHQGESPMGVGLGAHRQRPLIGVLLGPVMDQLVGVRRPVFEPVVEGTGRQAHVLTERGEFETAIAQFGQHFQARLEVLPVGLLGNHLTTV
jgi:hypothetical protein